MSCDDKLYHEKVIGRVTERQHSSLHEIAKFCRVTEWQHSSLHEIAKFCCYSNKSYLAVVQIVILGCIVVTMDL